MQNPLASPVQAAQFLPHYIPIATGTVLKGVLPSSHYTSTYTSVHEGAFLVSINLQMVY